MKKNRFWCGNDGNIYISPTTLKFGTVKVGFHKKLIFSIYNPTITNFYIKIVPDPLILKKFSDKNVNNNLNEENNNNENNNNNDKNNISITSKESLEKNDEILSFDFTEGLIKFFLQKRNHCHIQTNHESGIKSSCWNFCYRAQFEIVNKRSDKQIIKKRVNN